MSMKLDFGLGLFSSVPSIWKRYKTIMTSEKKEKKRKEGDLTNRDLKIIESNI